MTDHPIPIGRAEEEALIALVRRAARAELVPRFRRLGPEAARAKSAADDLVTEADLAMEAVLAEGVRAVLPGAAVVGEEAVAAEPGLRAAVGAELDVIVDPLDGTWNFAHGVAVFGVILAVARWGEPVWGLLHDPLLDDWVVARRAGGAWFGRPGEDPVRLRVAPQAPPEAMMGFVPLFLFPPERRRAVADAMLAFGRATSLRCACHEHRLLAQGRVHFVLGAGLEPWDHAAARSPSGRPEAAPSFSTGGPRLPARLRASARRQRAPGPGGAAGAVRGGAGVRRRPGPAGERCVLGASGGHRSLGGLAGRKEG